MSIIAATTAATLPTTVARTAAATAPPAAPVAVAVAIKLLLAFTLPLSLIVLYRCRRSLARFRPAPPDAGAGPLFATLLLTFGIWTFTTILFTTGLEHSPVPADLRQPLGYLLSTLAGIAAVLILALQLLARRARPLSLLAPARFPRGLAGGAVAFLLVIPWILLADNAFELLLRHYHITARQEHEVFQTWDTPAGHAVSVRLLTTVTAVFISPIFEELLFRGLLQTTLLTALTPRRPTLPPASPIPDPSSRRPVFPNVLAIFFTSICFAAIHQPWTIQPAIFLLSLALGYAYERSNNLWQSITLHGLFNAFNIALYLTLHA